MKNRLFSWLFPEHRPKALKTFLKSRGVKDLDTQDSAEFILKLIAHFTTEEKKATFSLHLKTDVAAGGHDDIAASDSSSSDNSSSGSSIKSISAPEQVTLDDVTDDDDATPSVEGKSDWFLSCLDEMESELRQVGTTTKMSGRT